MSKQDKPLLCDHVDRVSLHPSVQIGGWTVGKCERQALPGLCKCEYHAPPEAIKTVMLRLAQTKGEANGE